MESNCIIDLNISPKTGFAYPCTTAEAKTFMKISNTAEDTLIEEIIKAATRHLHNYTGVAFMRSDVTTTVKNELGGIELPFGPMIGATDLSAAALTIDGTAVDSTAIDTVGSYFVQLNEPLDTIKCVYTSGYYNTGDTGVTVANKIPDDLKQDVLRLVNYLYFNRGDNNVGAFIKSLSIGYRRAWVIL